MQDQEGRIDGNVSSVAVPTTGSVRLGGERAVEQVNEGRGRQTEIAAVESRLRGDLTVDKPNLVAGADRDVASTALGRRGHYGASVAEEERTLYVEPDVPCQSTGGSLAFDRAGVANRQTRGLDVDAATVAKTVGCGRDLCVVENVQ